MRYLGILSVFLLVAVSLPAQTVDTSVCDILKNPASFDGKIVRLKGTALAGFDEFVIKDPTCKQAINSIWLAYPEGTKAKAGPVVALGLQLAKNSPGSVTAPSRASVKLDKNKEFKQFDSLLATPYKSHGMCLGCGKYVVTATFTGRLDGTASVELKRDSSGKFVAASGFGNMNRYPARLVLESVADVSAQEIDYSKAASETKDDAVRDASGDPVAAGHNAAKAFPAGTPAAEQIEQAAAAYGKEGEDNGVVVGFGVANELVKGDGAKGDANSPDGLLLICTFDMDRLKGEALSRAMTHTGTHIAEVRGTNPSDSLATAEYRAWQTTVLSAVATRQKTLTLPGGYVAWDNTWPNPERSKRVDDAISEFLQNWAGIGK